MLFLINFLQKSYKYCQGFDKVIAFHGNISKKQIKNKIKSLGGEPQLISSCLLHNPLIKMLKQEKNIQNISIMSQMSLKQLCQECPQSQFHQKLLKYIRSCSINTFISNIKLLSKIILYMYNRCKEINSPQCQKMCEELRKLLSEKKYFIDYNVEFFNLLLVKVFGQLRHQQKDAADKIQLMQFSSSSQFNIIKKYYQSSISQTVKPHQKTNQLVMKIATNKLFLPNPNSLGSSAFYQQQILSQTGEQYFVVQYQNNPTFAEDFRMAVCASFNNGGAYIFINRLKDHTIRGIQQIIHNEELLFNILKTQGEWLKCASPQNNNKLQQVRRQQISGQKISIYPDPFSSDICPSKAEKYIMRIKVQPIYPRICYIQNQVKSNKITKRFFMGRNNQVVEVQKEFIYYLVLGTYQMKKKKNYNEESHHFYPKISSSKKKFHEKIVVQDKNEEQTPLSKYKNLALVCISSVKYQAQIIKKVKEKLKQRKIVYYMNKPYTKYVKNAIRVIYSISHECQFEDLNKAIRSVDYEEKTRCIIVTKYMQVKVAGKDQQLTKMENIIKNNFGYQPMKQQRCEKVTPSSNSTSLFAFYQFKKRQQAILAFIYLDSVAVRAQLIKQYFAKFEHKKKI